MSEENNQQSTDPSATQPIKKTSAVPLRKETVRVTLKAPGAKPGGAPADSPPPPPAPTMNLGSAAGAPPKSLATTTGSLESPRTAPMTAPMTPPATSKIDIPDVTSAVPLKQETMRVTLKADRSGAPAAPAPTIPLGGASKPPQASPTPTQPAPTMKLGGAATVPLATQPLPKATVELEKTQQLTQGLGGPSKAATIKTVSNDDEVKRGGSGADLPLSIVAFVLSLVVLYFQFAHAKIWIDEHEGGETMSVFDPVEE